MTPSPEPDDRSQPDVPHSEPAETPEPPRTLRRARAAAMAAFFTNGALAASLMARYAEVKESLGLSPAVFGFVVVTLILGGALAGQLPAVALRRLGSRRVSLVGTIALTLFLVLATVGVSLGQVWMLVLGLVAAGACDAVVDVAQNAQGLRVQRAMGRSLISLMHAGWSAGAAVGGLVAIGAASAGIPLTPHLAGWGLLCIVAIGVASRAYLADRPVEPVEPTDERVEPSPTDERVEPAQPAAGAPDRPDQPTPAATEPAGTSPKLVRLPRHRVALLVAPLVIVALAGITVEDVANNWSAVFLAQERGVELGTAGMGLTAILGAQFVGRLVGDRVVDALGNRLALQVSLAAVVLGILLATWVPSLPVTMAGFVLAGLGCAVTVPVAFTEADRLPGLRAQTGVTLVSWAMRVATLVLSPLVGTISTALSIQVAFTAVAVIAAAGLVASMRVRSDQR